MRFVAIGCCFLTLIGCKRESREVRRVPTVSDTLDHASADSALYPGGDTTHLIVHNPYEVNAYAISEGSASSFGTTAPVVTPMAAAAPNRPGVRRIV